MNKKIMMDQEFETKLVDLSIGDDCGPRVNDETYG